jgi:hypothetical protein
MFILLFIKKICWCAMLFSATIIIAADSTTFEIESVDFLGVLDALM